MASRRQFRLTISLRKDVKWVRISETLDPLERKTSGVNPLVNLAGVID